MRRLFPLLAGVLLVTPVFAAADSFDLAVANILILQDRRIQNELKITEAQRTKMNGLAQADIARKKPIVEAAQKAKQKQLTPEQARRMQASFLVMRSSVLAILNPVQLKRLREITIQGAGTAALLDASIAKRLAITPAQRKTLADAFRTGQTQAQAIQHSAAAPVLKKYQAKKPKDQAEGKKLQAAFQAELRTAGAAVAPRLRTIEVATAKKMLGTITPAQKSQFEALKGRLFRPS